MELQSFISKSLVQIAKGIGEAGKELEGTTAIINPECVSATAGIGDKSVYGYLEDKGTFKRAVHEIFFDIAVTAAKGTETKGGIGIVVGAIALGSQGRSGAEKSSYSRIKFKVPMALPVQV